MAKKRGLREGELTTALYFFFGFGLMSSAFCLFLGVVLNPAFSRDVQSLATIGVVILGLLGLALYRQGRRWSGVYLASDLKAVESPYVLYLRSYGDDQSQGGPFVYSIFCHKTREEQLELTLRPFGQVVAVSDARFRVPDLGASRGPLASTDWQRDIVRLLKNANLVVIRLGASPGIVWETARALNQCSPQKLVVLVPNDVTAYLRSQSLLAEYGVARLPKAPPRNPDRGLWGKLITSWVCESAGRLLSRQETLVGSDYLPRRPSSTYLSPAVPREGGRPL